MQYLILHKVRGQPSYDIAEKCLIGDEEGWVLCTCGHRAYPLEHWPLSEILNGAGPILEELVATFPKDWPDHYQAKPEPKLDISVGWILGGLSKFKRRL